MNSVLSYNLNNIHIVESSLLPTPEELKTDIPLSDNAGESVWNTRKAVINILKGIDNRKLLIVGPCSIHDYTAAIDYAQRIKALADTVEDKFLILMRVYFEKPRTTIGWKGLINDPDMDNSFNLEKGLRIARQLMMEITEIGLGIATEALDPIVPQYIGELISWVSIGARTTESQTHREMASGLSMPVGFKNGTDGNISTAMNALKAALSSHRFMGITQKGSVAVFNTTGNPNGHVVLRGGTQPNYHAGDVEATVSLLKANGLPSGILVDCSHGNSNKDYTRQAEVFRNVAQQMRTNPHLIGLMLESNINPGSQPISADLQYGVSVTDPCLGWTETEQLITNAYLSLSS